jgi:hypothetical protein
MAREMAKLMSPARMMMRKRIHAVAEARPKSRRGKASS